MTAETPQTPAPDTADTARDAALARDAVDALFRGAHTTYHFTDEPVDLEQVRAAYDDARWAPTAFNSQPLRMVAVATPEARERLTAHMATGNADRTAEAPLALVLAFDPRWHEHLPHLAPGRGEGMRDSFEDKAEMRASQGRLSATLQSGYLILALRAHGLQVGPMAGFDQAGVTAEFLAEDGFEPLMVLNVGHEAHPEREGAVRPRGGRLEFGQVARVV